jgi:hypothetical protein
MEFKIMRKAIFLLVTLGAICFVRNSLAQEKFIDVRQEMANKLTAVKTAAAKNDWAAALENFTRAKEIWQGEVRPMITEGVKTNEQFREYFKRMAEIEENLNILVQILEGKNTEGIESKANAVIWGISHHPRGFDLPQPRYSAWDWVFALVIGLGFCIFATVFGLYLRKSYYRRYKKIQIMN